ncbi:GLE1-like protein, partial [Kipferlia bialata]
NSLFLMSVSHDMTEREQERLRDIEESEREREREAQASAQDGFTLSPSVGYSPLRTSPIDLSAETRNEQPLRASPSYLPSPSTASVTRSTPTSSPSVKSPLFREGVRQRVRGERPMSPFFRPTDTVGEPCFSHVDGSPSKAIENRERERLRQTRRRAIPVSPTRGTGDEARTFIYTDDEAIACEDREREEREREERERAEDDAALVLPKMSTPYAFSDSPGMNAFADLYSSLFSPSPTKRGPRVSALSKVSTLPDVQSATNTTRLTSLKSLSVQSREAEAKREADEKAREAEAKREADEQARLKRLGDEAAAKEREKEREKEKAEEAEREKERAKAEAAKAAAAKAEEEKKKAAVAQAAQQHTAAVPAAAAPSAVPAPSATPTVSAPAAVAAPTTPAANSVVVSSESLPPFIRFSADIHSACIALASAVFSVSSPISVLAQQCPEQVQAQLTKEIRMRCNQISADNTHRASTTRGLASIMAGVPYQEGNMKVDIQAPSGYGDILTASAATRVAKDLLDAIQRVDISNSESDPQDEFMPILSVVKALCNRFPAFLPLFLSHLYTKCPLAIPCVAGVDPALPKGRHRVGKLYEARGYIVTGLDTPSPELEAFAKFSRRQISLAAFLAGLCTGGGVGGLELESVWQWIVRFIKLPVQKESALVLDGVIRMARTELKRVYGQQYIDLINLIGRLYLPLLEAK